MYRMALLCRSALASLCRSNNRNRQYSHPKQRIIAIMSSGGNIFLNQENFVLSLPLISACTVFVSCYCSEIPFFILSWTACWDGSQFWLLNVPFLDRVACLVAFISNQRDPCSPIVWNDMISRGGPFLNGFRRFSWVRRRFFVRRLPAICQVKGEQ